jgi:hypothetical protein
MDFSWRELLDRAGRTVNRQTVIAGAVAGVGAAIAIGAMEFFSLAARYPLAVIPFATSIVLVIGSPEAEPAQPRALIGGHIVATVVGLIVLRIAGPHVWSAAAAVGLAVLAMFLTGTFHPPAGINPPAGRFKQPVVVISDRACACRSGAFDYLRVCLAPMDRTTSVAAALDLAAQDAFTLSPASRTANRSPSRASVTPRW